MNFKQYIKKERKIKSLKALNKNDLQTLLYDFFNFIIKNKYYHVIEKKQDSFSIKIQDKLWINYNIIKDKCLYYNKNYFITFLLPCLSKDYSKKSMKNVYIFKDLITNFRRHLILKVLKDNYNFCSLCEYYHIKKEI